MKNSSESKRKFNIVKRMKIRPKLIGIISIIIVTSLSILILLATEFFLGESRVRNEENNHKLANITSQKIESDLTALVDKLNLIGTTMLQEFKTKEQKNLFIDIFFRNEKNFIYVALVKKKKDKFDYYKKIYNKQYFSENQIPLSDIKKINRINENNFQKSFFNDSVIFNVSKNFNSPVISLSFPYKKNISNGIESIIVSYIRLDKFLEAFRKKGISESFMVNHEGDIIAHYDPKIVMAHANYLNVPIVDMMMKSKIDNGQKRYENLDGNYYIGAFKKIDFSGIGVFVTVKEDDAFQEVYRIQRFNLYIMGILLIISFVIVYYFGKTITTPILRLFKATKQIEEGEFIINLKPTSGDEIGQLTSSFVHMGKGLEEREKMKDAFGKFVNKEIAEQVLKGEIKLGGERKKASVFFSDIRSFTAISEKLEPEEVVEFLNEYMTKMVNCVNDTHGVVDKYIGDAIMAIWGVPISKGNDTENAINGALMMRKELIDFNVGRGGDKKPIIKIGSGINTGPVLAGQIGSEDKMEYTVIGDAVNLASRIEALNKPFGTDILISQDTYIEIKDIFNVVAMKKIKVKGKTEPQQIYAVLGRKDDPDAPATLHDLRIMVGIDYEEKESNNDEEKEVKYEIIE